MVILLPYWDSLPGWLKVTNSQQPIRVATEALELSKEPVFTTERLAGVALRDEIEESIVFIETKQNEELEI